MFWNNIQIKYLFHTNFVFRMIFYKLWKTTCFCGSVYNLRLMHVPHVFIYQCIDACLYLFLFYAFFHICCPHPLCCVPMLSVVLVCPFGFLECLFIKTLYIYIYIYQGMDVVEWSRMLDGRLSEWCCSVSMVWAQFPSREEQKFDSSKI